MYHVETINPTNNLRIHYEFELYGKALDKFRELDKKNLPVRIVSPENNEIHKANLWKLNDENLVNTFLGR